MENQGASSPSGIRILTTNLSKPFTRLDKYPSHLKELERHTDVSMTIDFDKRFTILWTLFTNVSQESSVLKIIYLCCQLQGSHVDRGDTQRAISVYKDIAVSSTTLIRSHEYCLKRLTQTTSLNALQLNPRRFVFHCRPHATNYVSKKNWNTI